MAQLLGPDGQPISSKSLAQEVATPTIAGVRRIHEERVTAGLTPDRLGRILRQAQEGDHRDYLTLAEEMEERYLHYASQLQTRRLAIDGIEISVDAPAGVPAKIVDFVTSLKEDPSFLAAASAMSDAIAKSYSVIELMWDYQDGALRPVEYVWRDPRFFQFDKLSGRQLRLAVDGSVEGEELPAAKFVRHVPSSRMGLPIRRGVARAAAWAFIVQSFALQDWAAFAEVYGMPFRVGKYHGAATEAEKKTLLRAVSQIANDAAAIIPESMSIEFIETNGSQGSAVFGDLLDYIDKNVSKLVVGQTMTSDNGSSLGQAKIHNEVRLDILRSDCQQQAITLNRDLVEMAVAMNFGPQEKYPQLRRHVADPEDITAIADGVAKLVPLGFRVGQREMREKFGLSEPEAGEDVLVPPAAPATPEPDPAKPALTKPAPTGSRAPVPGARDKPAKPAQLGAHVTGCRCGGCLTALAAEMVRDGTAVEEIDAVLAEAMADYETIVDPLVGPLAAIVEQAGSFEEALAMLAARAPQSDELATALEKATAIARAIGDVKD